MTDWKCINLQQQFFNDCSFSLFHIIINWISLNLRRNLGLNFIFQCIHELITSKLKETNPFKKVSCPNYLLIIQTIFSTFLGFLAQNCRASKKIFSVNIGAFFATWSSLCLFICVCRSLDIVCSHFSVSWSNSNINFLLTFGHFNSNLSLSLFSPLSFGLWSNKEICLGAKYFPLRVFKHLGSLLLFLSVSHSKFLSFCLCLLWSVM